MLYTFLFFLILKALFSKMLLNSVIKLNYILAKIRIKLLLLLITALLFKTLIILLFPLAFSLLLKFIFSCFLF